MELKLFPTITPAQFAGSIRWFKNKTAEARDRFESIAAYALHRLFETGDVSHVNKVAGVIEAFGYGPAFRRCVVPNVPYKYDKDALMFDGPIQKGKRAALEVLNEEGIPKWEADLRARFDSEGKPKEQKVKVAEDYLKAIDRAVANAIKHDVPACDAKKRALAAVRNNTVAEVKAA